MSKLRRGIVTLAAPLALLACASPAVAAVIHVVKSEYCGCCGDWVEHLRKAGHQVKVTNGDPIAEADRLGVPRSLRSCHTATVGKYALEGHVPAADIARLLREKPNAAGIAVPGMPAGSPGMEAAGKQPFQTILFKRDGTTKVFASH